MGIRIVTAVAVLVSAIVHLYLWLDGVRDQGTVGQLFVVNVVAGVVIAGLLLGWRTHWLPPFLAAGFGASTLAAFVISTTVGLFGIHAHWEGWPAWTAAASEVVAMVGGLVLLRTLDLRRGTSAPRARRGFAPPLMRCRPCGSPYRRRASSCGPRPSARCRPARSRRRAPGRPAGR